MANIKFGKFEYSEEELQKQFEEATQRAEETDRREPRAVKADYDKGADRIVIEMTNGVTVGFPPHLLQGLAGASSADLAEVELSPHGTSLHWEKLDVDFSVSGLISGVFGTHVWMADLGRIGGQKTSEVKAAAARANGRKGGRPRKTNLSAILSAPVHEFETELGASLDLQLAHLALDPEVFPHLLTRELAQAERFLEEADKAIIASIKNVAIKGELVQHPTPVMLKDDTPPKYKQKFSEIDADFGLAA